MSNFLDTLTAVEKALGLTPVEVPENWEDFVKEEEFTPSSFIRFIKEEVDSQSKMDAETKELHKEYLAGMISLAKFTFDQKAKPNQITIPRARDFGPMAMKVWQALQNAARPKMAGMSFKKEEGQEVEKLMDGEVLSKFSVEDLAKCLAPALIKLLEGDLEEKATEVEKTTEDNIEAVQTKSDTEDQPEVETVEVAEVVKSSPKLGTVEDIVIDGEELNLGAIGTWIR